MAPFFSVIVPCYRVAHRPSIVRECLTSIAAQTLPDFELLLVDDGSPDRTSQVLRELIEGERALRERSRVLTLRVNGGVCVARNAGIDAARGRYLAFVDFDDLWQPRYLQAVAEALTADAARRVILVRTDFLRSLGHEMRVASSGSIAFLNEFQFPDFAGWHLLNAFPVGMGSAMVAERSLFQEQPDLKYDVALSRTTAEDVLLGFLLLNCGIRPWYVDEPLCVARNFLEEDSRGKAAFFRIDEKQVNDYIFERATASLTEKILLDRPQLRSALEHQRRKLDLQFELKRNYLQRSGGTALRRCLRSPRGIKTLLRLVAMDRMTRSPVLASLLRRYLFVRGRRDSDAERRVRMLLGRIEQSREPQISEPAGKIAGPAN